ncbi:protein kinase [Agreia sp.]|uniref:protein kinase n=1 Tax=Agreia sp. TaxID=1872416 RepID=UPI0035BBB97E
MSSVDIELAALSSIDTPHIVRLIDVASIEAGEPPCLVLERLPGPALSTHLGQHASIDAGQAVTILAPLCATVQALHDAGVTHGAIHLRRIVFDQRGAPTLTGFGRGMLREMSAAQEAESPVPGRVHAVAPASTRATAWRAAVHDDQRDLLAVVSEVLSRVDADAPLAMDRVEISALSSEIGAGPSREFLPRLETALFALARPQVVAVDAVSSGADFPAPDQPLPAREHSVVSAQATEYDWAASTTVAPPPEAENRLIAALRVLGASSAVLELASSVVDVAVRSTSQRRLDRDQPSAEGTKAHRSSPRHWGRRPLIVGVSCAVVATTALLLALPSSGDGAQAGAGDVRPSGTHASEVHPGEPARIPPIGEEPSLLGDDPAAALQALSRTSEGCSASTEEKACRLTVFQTEYLDSLPAGDAPIVIGAADAVVTGVWGGSALVAARLNDQPASFLLMKGEAGWRVRDVFVGDQ